MDEFYSQTSSSATSPSSIFTLLPSSPSSVGDQLHADVAAALSHIKLDAMGRTSGCDFQNKMFTFRKDAWTHQHHRTRHQAIIHKNDLLFFYCLLRHKRIPFFLTRKHIYNHCIHSGVKPVTCILSRLFRPSSRFICNLSEHFPPWVHRQEYTAYLASFYLHSNLVFMWSCLSYTDTNHMYSTATWQLTLFISAKQNNYQRTKHSLFMIKTTVCVITTHKYEQTSIYIRISIFKYLSLLKNGILRCRGD